MSIELDDKDLTILSRLNEDGRTTYSDLAAELALTVPTVKSRIDKLIKIGVIDHIGVYLKPHSLTKEGAALISLHVSSKDLEEIINYLSSLEEIREVYEVLDEFNILILTQHQPLNMHHLIFEELKNNALVKKAQIKILTKELFSKPHRIPKDSFLLNIRCEYCGKQITESYESEKLADVRHYFCCSSCLKNYKKWWQKQISH
ncbi:MAG: winged helix-turn-helix transcriptional regulator [Candidatus Hodarchaeales archaeon]